MRITFFGQLLSHTLDQLNTDRRNQDKPIVPPEFHTRQSSGQDPQPDSNQRKDEKGGKNPHHLWLLALLEAG